MSVAVALKNIVLMLLIILILHFLIKNVLLERKKTEPCVPYIAIEQKVCPQPIQEEIILIEEAEEIVAPKPKERRRNKKVCGEKKEVDVELELQQFVFEEASDELERFFAAAPADPPEVSKIDKETKEPSANRGSTSNVSFVNEYKNESVLNSGDPFGTGLMAFDAFDSKFGGAAPCGGAAGWSDDAPLGPPGL